KESEFRYHVQLGRGWFHANLRHHGGGSSARGRQDSSPSRDHPAVGEEGGRRRGKGASVGGAVLRKAAVSPGVPANWAGCRGGIGGRILDRRGPRRAQHRAKEGDLHRRHTAGLRLLSSPVCPPPEEPQELRCWGGGEKFGWLARTPDLPLFDREQRRT